MSDQSIKKSITESEFHKWRCLVSMAHADGVVTKEERNMINHQLRTVDLSADQHATIVDDFENPKDFKQVYTKVSDEEDKKHLVQLAYTLFWSDNEFHEAEHKIFTFINESIKNQGG